MWIGRRFCAFCHSSRESVNQLKRLTYSTSVPMNEMLLRNARLSPSMAVPMSATVTMPITMPRVVRMDRILLARMAAQEMPMPSRISVNRFIPRSTRNPRRAGDQGRLLLVTGDQTVPDADNAVGVAGDIFLMGNDDDSVAALPQLAEKR